MQKPYTVVCHTSNYKVWTEERKNSIGASDQIGEALFLTKTGQKEAFTGNRYSFWGQQLEAPIITGLQKWSGLRTRPSGFLLRSTERPHMSATLDGLAALPITEKGQERFQRYLEMDLGLSPEKQIDYKTMRGLAVLEIKALGANRIPEFTSFAQKYNKTLGFWSTSTKNVKFPVPKQYYDQVQQQLYVTGLDKGWLAVLLAGQTVLLYPIERDEDVIKKRCEECDEIWGKIRAYREQPEGSSGF